MCDEGALRGVLGVCHGLAVCDGEHMSHYVIVS